MLVFSQHREKWTFAWQVYHSNRLHKQAQRMIQNAKGVFYCFWKFYFCRPPTAVPLISWLISSAMCLSLCFTQTNVPQVLSGWEMLHQHQTSFQQLLSKLCLSSARGNGCSQFTPLGHEQVPPGWSLVGDIQTLRFPPLISGASLFSFMTDMFSLT